MCTELCVFPDVQSTANTLPLLIAQPQHYTNNLTAEEADDKCWQLNPNPYIAVRSCFSINVCTSIAWQNLNNTIKVLRNHFHV